MRTLLLALLIALLTPPAVAQEKKALKALMITGGCCHDYEKQKKILADGISARANVEWTIVHEGEGEKKGGTRHMVSVYKDPDWAKGYDVVVHAECFADVKDKAFVEGILKPHKDDGVPAVNLHCAMHCYRVPGYDEWFKFVGLKSTGHGPQKPIDIMYKVKDHPITKGLPEWTTINEELYNNVGQPFDTATVLATGKQGPAEAVVIWTNTYGKAKVFSTTLGHNNGTVADPKYLDLVTRGLLWSTGKLTDDGKPADGYEPVKK